MADNLCRIESLEEELKTINLAKKIAALFPQISTETLFIQALKSEIPDSNTASLIWFTLNECDELLSILHGSKR